jgi:hypothetical protein
VTPLPHGVLADDLRRERPIFDIRALGTIASLGAIQLSHLSRKDALLTESCAEMFNIERRECYEIRKKQG